MRINAKYSHLNGEEYLIVHKPALWREVQDVIDGVDAMACKTKVSKEKKMVGRMLYSPAGHECSVQNWTGGVWLGRAAKHVLGNGQRAAFARYLRASG